MRTLAAFTVIVLPLCVPAQGWEAMANLPANLTFPVVVELQGKIHVMGGGGSGGATALHLRYTPATDTWDTLASVPYLAQQPCGAVVNGEIHYCGGGFPNTGTPLADHYVYDPVLNSWYQAASMPFPTAINEAASLNGKLYVLSGQPDKRLCQSYDPGPDLWTPHNDLPDMNFWYGAVQTVGNTIFRFGGGGYAAPVVTAHTYDPVNDNWNGIPSLPMAIHAPAGADIGGGQVCITGGFYNFEYLDSVWIYDVAMQTYTTAEPLPAGRAYHSMVRVGGCVYSVGGSSSMDPNMGFSLIRNCTIGVSVPSIVPPSEVPYTKLVTPDAFQLQWSATFPGINAQVEMIDGNGRSLKRYAIGSGALVIPSREFSAGAYMIVITADDRRFMERWIVTP